MAFVSLLIFKYECDCITFKPSNERYVYDFYMIFCITSQTNYFYVLHCDVVKIYKNKLII